jgi:UDP-N-acetylglucosamine 4,6-dehydratase/5-epimerase
MMRGHSVLVTGGTGAFGKAFVQRALAGGAGKVVVFSRDEAKQAALRVQLNDDRVRYLIGDVRDANRLLDACRGIDVVVHAAALKRVETCEADPNEAVATNVVGTQNVARACVERGVERAVFLSTDKAAEPNTLYGATKLAAERLWLASNVYAAGTATRFSATRYGNVLGSTGSVLPLWRALVAQGEKIPVTHLGMTRFWMTMRQAVDLVELAIAEMRGGEVFVPKIGAAPLTTLADAISPGAEVDVVGMRPGEKVHETLISAEEARHTYDLGTHYVIEPAERTWGSVRPLRPSRRVCPDFRLRSDTAPRQLDSRELKEMLRA